MMQKMQPKTCLDELRTEYDDLILEDDLKRFVHKVDKFLEKFKSRLVLKKVCLLIDEMRVTDKAELGDAKKELLDVLAKEYEEIQLFCKKESIVLPKEYIEAYEYKRKFSGLGVVGSQFGALVGILNFLLSEGHISIVKKLATVSVGGEISHYSFYPNYFKWLQKKRDLTKKVWYCFDQLRLLEETHCSLEPEMVFLEDKEVLAWREMVAIGEDQQKDVNDYKPLIKILYDYTREYLFCQGVGSIGVFEFDYCYEVVDGIGGGVVSSGDKEMVLEGNEAKLLYRVAEIGKKVNWTDLTDRDFPKKGNIDSARRGLNDSFKITFMLQQKVLPSDGGYIKLDDSVSIRLVK